MSQVPGTGGVLPALALGLHIASAYAQAPPAAAEPLRSSAAEKTLKERLSDKASDEQRVDNCKVPKDRRGTKPRPEGCAPEPPGRTPANPPH